MEQTIQHLKLAARPVFNWVQARGVATDEMYHVFNMGIGFVLIVAPEAADAVQSKIAAHNFGVWQIG